MESHEEAGIRLKKEAEYLKNPLIYEDKENKIKVVLEWVYSDTEEIKGDIIFDTILGEITYHFHYWLDEGYKGESGYYHFSYDDIEEKARLKMEKVIIKFCEDIFKNIGE